MHLRIQLLVFHWALPAPMVYRLDVQCNAYELVSLLPMRVALCSWFLHHVWMGMLECGQNYLQSSCCADL